MKRAVLIGGALFAAALAVLAGIVLVRTLALDAPEARESVEAGATDAAAVDLEAVERLAGALRIQTVSQGDGPPRKRAIRRLRRYLAREFPLVHRDLDRRVLAGGSLLFTWTPADPAAAAKRPLLLLAHQDVVPVGPDDAWTQPPFAGVVDGEHVWGRGALDDKGSLVAILEAAEGLLRDGFTPERPVLFAFGHDEEVGGSGARAIAAELASRGVEPFLILDEGMAITEGMLPGTASPVALIGVAEKGYLSLELRARAEGGHSSMPPRQTAIDVLVRALDRLRAAPLPAGVDGPVAEMLEAVAPAMDFDKRLVLANLWLFEPLVIRELAQQAGTDALIRTTTAPTMLSGSVKDNVLPTEAKAVVNFRLHPRDREEGVIAHVRRAIADPRVEVVPYGAFASPPSPVAPTTGPAFELLRDAVRRIAPEAVVAPALVLGGTDARHYTGLTDSIYRFVPFTLADGDLERVHGIDERLALRDFQRMIRFYRELIAAPAEGTAARGARPGAGPGGG